MMNIEKFSISYDPAHYEAWPDVTLAADGKLICVFSECTHHCNRAYTRIMLCESSDEGRNWTARHPLTEGTEGLPYYYNCARISTMPDGKLVVIVDRIPSTGEGGANQTENVFYTSSDNGMTWSSAQTLPLKGIVPDKFRLLNNGRLAIAAHKVHNGHLAQFLHYSDDGGKNWSDPVLVAADPRYELCEVCLVPMGGNTVAALLRENSGQGYDCIKTVSTDNGASWGPLVNFPLPGCHRPVAGFLRDGKVFITYRFHHGGGRCGMGKGSQNFFCAISDRESLLAENRSEAFARIIPVDYDRSIRPDTGYSGWVQLKDGSVYIVNYIVDDAETVGQIRGYRLNLEDFMLKTTSRKCSCCNCEKNTCPRYK